jgi:hypothetical protein
LPAITDLGCFTLAGLGALVMLIGAVAFVF